MTSQSDVYIALPADKTCPTCGLVSRGTDSKFCPDWCVCSHLKNISDINFTKKSFSCITSPSRLAVYLEHFAFLIYLHFSVVIFLFNIYILQFVVNKHCSVIHSHIYGIYLCLFVCYILITAGRIIIQGFRVMVHVLVVLYYDHRHLAISNIMCSVHINKPVIYTIVI